MTYREFTHLLAKYLGVSPSEGRKVADAVIKTLKKGLRTEGKVSWLGFGKFVMRTTRNELGSFRTAKFSTFKKFRQSMNRKEDPMDKYGVQIDQDKTKEARVTGKCPTCQQPLPKDSTGSYIMKCDTCGTKPFE